MSQNNERHAEEDANPASNGADNGQSPSNGQRTNHYTPGSPEFIAELKRGLEQTRLPADQREQILADMPSLEEQERQYREMQEHGGLSFDEFCASVGLDIEAQP